MLCILVFVSFFAAALAATVPPGIVPINNFSIVGGNEIAIEKCPYQLSLRYFGSHSCGATIYKSNIALTAAHCVGNRFVHLVKLRAGSNDSTKGGVSLSVKRIIMHKKYSRRTLAADIALVFLKGNFEYSSTIQPIVLPRKSPAAGSEALVSGWGYTKECASAGSVKLRAANLQIIDHEVCRKANSNIRAVSSGMICAAVEGYGTDSCKGDSGGPLSIGMTQVGIVSWGHGCATADYPGVYTDVAKYVAWIKSMSKISVYYTG